MRYYEPVLRLGVLLPSQTKLEDKLGGLPWGLPAGRWPICKACEKPLSFLAQFVHHPERLDLGAPGRVLFAFQCNHNPGECETWRGDSGANACFVLEETELTGSETPAPPGDPAVETEARVTTWQADDDGVTAEQLPSFFDEETYYDLPEELTDEVPFATKAGGAPAWVQGAGEGPPAPWRFVLQLDSSLSFDGPLPSANDVGCTVTRENDAGDSESEEPAEEKEGAPPWIAADDEDGYYCGGPNYGGDGSAYVFVNTDGPRAEAWLFWQC